MATPGKKRNVDVERNLEDKESSGSSDESSEYPEQEEYMGQKEIQVDFEGRNPTDSDFHGIKQLLQQLFLKAHVNLSELTDLIVSQNYVGSVVKQSEVDEDSDDDDGDDGNDVFGITTVINLTDKQERECVQQLRSLLLELSREHATDSAATQISSLIADDTRPIGLLINERFVNIPAQISVPLLENLSKEIKRAKEKKMPFDFAYYVIICKLYKADKTSKKKKKNKKADSECEQDIIWSNPEEEIINQEADCWFEFCVQQDSDSALSGSWLEDDTEMVPYRRVLLVPASNLEPVIEKIKDFVSSKNC
ncbi:protein BCCIP homolog [Schistocerca americana]|uniref:protein BCCIP homolog n=1 Tax=Schistocerca americana TaxID=7009 RepID=UPI001F4FBAD2|nr:protein BCCIP homolog [Schistocerca americana]XP_047111759.1 protein BCCIP homolog [Schistocerca piceifrons]